MKPARLELAEAALQKAWAKGWASRPPLDPDAVVGVAERRVGANVKDDPCGWRERLALLCGDLEARAQLSGVGRTIAHGQLVAAVMHRIRAEALWARYPAILELPIAAPIIVVGQMRSGSTRMQRLLACDPRLAHTRFFESWNPLPLGAPHALIDDRKWRSRVGLLCARLLNPGFDVTHPTGWNAPDEEIGLHNVSIFGSSFEVQWRVPSFTAQVEEGDAVPVYREFKRLLQTLAWLRRDGGHAPWVLKVPQFTQDLDALLRVFPGARLIFLTRDPVAVVGSSASLVRNQMMLQSDHVDPRWIGREWVRKVALREQRIAASRAGTDAPGVEVSFAGMQRDWKGEMARVYRTLGLQLDERVSAAMRSYLRGSNRRRAAPHRYDIAEFGLGEATIRSVVGASNDGDRPARAWPEPSAVASWQGVAVSE